MAIDKDKYPEFAKLNDIPESERQLLGSFVEHLEIELGIDMCIMENHCTTPYFSRGKHFPIAELIASYFDIDYEQFQIEQEACMQEALAHQRELNKKVGHG